MSQRTTADTSCNDGGFLERLLAFPMSDEMRAKEKFRKGAKWDGEKGSKEGTKTGRLIDQEPPLPRALISEGGLILGGSGCVLKTVVH